MNKKFFIAIVITIALAHSRLFCDQIITFFFKPYPSIKDQNKITKKINKLARPEKLALYAIEAKLDQYMTSGIFCAYNGYLSISDLNGQVIFPRRHKDNEVNILVTDIIFPVFMIGNTIDHWEIEKENPAKMYHIKRMRDRAIGLYFWEVKETEVPKNRIIDMETVVVMTKPKYVYMPEGVTTTQKNIQLHIPDVYIKQGINKVVSALYTFGIKNFFKSMDYLYKKSPKRYSQQMRDVSL